LQNLYTGKYVEKEKTSIFYETVRKENQPHRTRENSLHTSFLKFVTTNFAGLVVYANFSRYKIEMHKISKPLTRNEVVFF